MYFHQEVLTIDPPRSTPTGSALQWRYERSSDGARIADKRRKEHAQDFAEANVRLWLIIGAPVVMLAWLLVLLTAWHPTAFVIAKALSLAWIIGVPAMHALNPTYRPEPEPYPIVYEFQLRTQPDAPPLAVLAVISGSPTPRHAQPREIGTIDRISFEIQSPRNEDDPRQTLHANVAATATQPFHPVLLATWTDGKLEPTSGSFAPLQQLHTQLNWLLRHSARDLG